MYSLFIISLLFFPLQVILITHEPTWVIDWYNGCVTVKPSAVKLHKLMIEHIKGLSFHCIRQLKYLCQY